MIHEVVRGIYTVDHQVAEGKNVVLFSQRGAWAVDTGSHAAEGQEMVDFIQQRGYEANRLLLTHGHGDHVLGSGPFQGADVFAHLLTPIEIERLLPVLAQRADTSTGQLRHQIAWPTITFRDELFLDLGDKHLHLFPTPGHSQDGVSIYVAAEKLLIAGDSVVTGIVPAIGDGDSTVLEASLRKLATMDIEVMIPGHGPVIYGKVNVQDWLEWLPNYLHRVRAFVRQSLKNGIPPDDIGAQADFDEFIGDRLDKQKHNMPKRHKNTVDKIVQEVTGQQLRDQ